MKDYSVYFDRMVMDVIEEKCTLSDILLSLKEVSGKLDTLISLKQVELKRQPQPPESIVSQAVSLALQDQPRHESRLILDVSKYFPEVRERPSRKE